MKRALGVDLGDARIGLALSDPLGMTAQPLPTLPAVGPRKDVARVAEIALHHEVGTVVIGLPLLMSGEDGDRAREARQFADRLRGRLPGVDVILQDERLTTVQAERTMVSDGVRRGRRRAVVDGVAAMLILQAHLDSTEGRA